MPFNPPKTNTMSNEAEVKPGVFMQSLLRNNKQIKEDRAIAIGESAEMIYKRTVEDIEVQIKQLRRGREAALDLSPTTADSLILANNFDSASFVSKDITAGIELRNLEIKLDIARKRYEELFTTT